MGKSLGVTRRGDTFHLRKRVPARYRDIEGRDTVWISLHTDSESVAKSKADRAWSQMIEAWEAKLAGDTEDAEARFAAAQELARVRGFRYLDVGKVAKLPVEALIERVEAVPAQADKAEVAALMGTVPEPQLTISKALDLYWTLAREKTFGKSEDQLRRWKNPRIKAVKNFVAVAGDKGIENITRDDNRRRGGNGDRVTLLNVVLRHDSETFRGCEVNGGRAMTARQIADFSVQRIQRRRQFAVAAVGDCQRTTFTFKPAKTPAEKE